MSIVLLLSTYAAHCNACLERQAAVAVFSVYRLERVSGASPDTKKTPLNTIYVSLNTKYTLLRLLILSGIFLPFLVCLPSSLISGLYHKFIWIRIQVLFCEFGSNLLQSVGKGLGCFSFFKQTVGLFYQKKTDEANVTCTKTIVSYLMCGSKSRCIGSTLILLVK